MPVASRVTDIRGFLEIDCAVIDLRTGFKTVLAYRPIGVRGENQIYVKKSSEMVSPVSLYDLKARRVIKEFGDLGAPLVVGGDLYDLSFRKADGIGKRIWPNGPVFKHKVRISPSGSLDLNVGIVSPNN